MIFAFLVPLPTEAEVRALADAWMREDATRQRKER
jgi:hypothetical protein